MSDVTEIEQLVVRERQSRVRALSDQLRECFHPDATVITSWVSGSADAFVAGARTRDAAGAPIINRLGPPIVHRNGTRAVVELPSTTTKWMHIAGVEAELASFMRLIYRVEERDGAWKISSLTAINEGDTLSPSIPGTNLEIDRELLGRFRHSYRFLAYTASLEGKTVPDSLYGIDQPEAVNELYVQAFAWLRS
jgi:hypothetical protein